MFDSASLVFGVLVSLGGAGLGYVDEVKGNGSIVLIVPAWLAHGTLNLVTYLWVLVLTSRDRSTRRPRLPGGCRSVVRP